jgi:hypothetical protein
MVVIAIEVGVVGGDRGKRDGMSYPKSSLS